MSGWRRVVVVVGTALVLAACGGISRGELDEEIQSRGGGLGSALPIEALAAVEDEVGEVVALRSLNEFPGYVTLEILVPGTQDEIDSYTYGTSGLYSGGGLSDATPVAGVGSAEELRAQLFRPDRVAFDELDAMVDEAIAEADLEGGYAQNVTISRSGQPVAITVTVTNPRRSVQVVFDADGTRAEEPS